MQVYETVTCHIDIRNINIENCKQIVPIILSGFDWWQPCQDRDLFKELLSVNFLCKLGDCGKRNHM
jgi:hypothetical protein